jgi:predicted flap endonuclease-1-like 5' DNA nuclease
MVKQALPCAEKNCNNKMILTENSGKLLYYNCQEKNNEHTFRYNVEQKKWEKIMIKTKLILNYNDDPLGESPDNISKLENKSNKTPDQATARLGDLTEINGIGSKRAEELESAGVKTVADLAKRSPKILAEKT